MSSKPSWKDVPEWAEWLAQDRDGEWWVYNTKPLAYPENGFWGPALAGGECEPVTYVPRNPNWLKTRELRPAEDEGEEEEEYEGCFNADLTKDEALMLAALMRHTIPKGTLYDILAELEYAYGSNALESYSIQFEMDEFNDPCIRII